jgi:hypothetical protein
MTYKTIADNLNNLNIIDFNSNVPIPYFIIDNFLPVDIINNIFQEWPSNPSISINTKFNSRIFFRDQDNFGPHTFKLINYLNSQEFLSILKIKTGLNVLVGDEVLENGGLHETLKGGFLGMHLDNLIHSKSSRLRVLNLIIYVEKDWPKNNGGQLKISSVKNGGNIEIEPVYNRAVIFKLSNDSLHGAPDPVLGLNGSTRKSIAMFYYGEVTNQSDDSDSRTLWYENNELKPFNGEY